MTALEIPASVRWPASFVNDDSLLQRSRQEGRESIETPVGHDQHNIPRRNFVREILVDLGGRRERLRCLSSGANSRGDLLRVESFLIRKQIRAIHGTQTNAISSRQRISKGFGKNAPPHRIRARLE